MTLAELKESVDNAIEYAKECECSPGDIQVTLQIDCDGEDSIWSCEDVELHYDNNADTSGCVLTAFKE